jgi:hypothetical protein
VDSHNRRHQYWIRSAIEGPAAKAAAVSAPFENLEISFSGVFIDLKMNTPLPTL